MKLISVILLVLSIALFELTAIPSASPASREDGRISSSTSTKPSVYGDGKTYFEAGETDSRNRLQQQRRQHSRKEHLHRRPAAVAPSPLTGICLKQAKKKGTTIYNI